MDLPLRRQEARFFHFDGRYSSGIDRHIILPRGARAGLPEFRVIQQRTRQKLEVFGVRIGNQEETEVRFIAASDALDSITAASTASRSVGILPAGSRSATFLIDPPVDLRRFRAVMLWSEAKHRNLVTAPLDATEQPELGAK